MKKVAVVYSSKRGSTRQYAEWITEELSKEYDCGLFPFDESGSLNLYEYDLIIYGGWIRGSGIVDFDNFGKKLDGELLERLILFGVGVALQTPENYMQVWSINVGKIDPKNEHRSIMYILDGKYDPAAVTGFDGVLMKIMKKVLTSGRTVDAASAADQMRDRLEKGIDLVRKENITSLLKDANRILNR